MTPKLPIGISDFRHVIEGGYYYVDKSRFIAETLTQAALVLLLPRPRRFGKTLNLSMLRYFLERAEESRAHLFRGLAVEQMPAIMARQGRYPVIFLTFKNVKATDFATCVRQIHELLSTEFERHAARVSPQFSQREEAQWEAILSGAADQVTLMNAIGLLMRVLRQAYQQNVIVLIDEYDAPIHAGHQYGYYDDIVLFMRNLLTAACKDNADLEKAVLTGILRVAKESIFSGLNNLDVYSVLNHRFAEYFGFTISDTERLLDAYALRSELAVVQAWYNGYLFGDQVIYNPWSVLHFLNKYPEEPAAYWINSASNELIRELILEGALDVQEHLENLLSDGVTACTLNDNIVLRDIRSSAETVLNLLVYSGYLKPGQRLPDCGGRPLYEVAIPNREVRLFYEDSIRAWLTRQTGDRRLRQLLRALTQEDLKTFGKVLQDMVIGILSYHDTAGDEPERVYHAFVLGLLVNLQDRYLIRSNRESGYGRYDMLLIPRNPAETGFVFEFKKIDQEDDNTPQAAMQSALQQIQAQEYAAELRDAGVTRILGVGVVVAGKRLWVEHLTL